MRTVTISGSASWPGGRRAGETVGCMRPTPRARLEQVPHLRRDPLPRTSRRSRTPGRLGLAAAALATVLLAACAAPTGQAAPPVSGSASPVASAQTAPIGPTVTAPQLSGPSSSAPADSSAAASTVPSASEVAPTPAPEPTTANEAPDATDDPADDATPAAEVPAPTAAPAPRTTARPAPAGGRTVVIDPGHNGANAANPDIINQPVDAGFGQTKACNTTGTSTDDGYPEHRFNWGVGQALRDELEAAGVTVIMTRDSDTGVGPCVNQRAAIGNQANADAVVSLHGDGADASVAGFYVLTAERAPAGAEMAGRSAALAGDIRDGLESAGLSPNNALGSNGLWERGDLAGLNLSLRPTVLIEFGNMRNPAEAALMSSAAGQQQYAEGVAKGVLAFLG